MFYVNVNFTVTFYYFFFILFSDSDISYIGVIVL